MVLFYRVDEESWIVWELILIVICKICELE